MNPPAPAAAAANAGRPAGCCAQIGMAVAAGLFAFWAFTIKSATFPNLPPECDTSAREILQLRILAWVLLLCATAQAGAATAALVLVPSSRLGGFLAFLANLLGLWTLGYLAQVVIRALSATTGALCLAGHARTVELIIYGVLANVLLYTVPLLCSVHQ